MEMKTSARCAEIQIGDIYHIIDKIVFVYIYMFIYIYISLKMRLIHSQTYVNLRSLILHGF